MYIDSVCVCVSAAQIDFKLFIYQSRANCVKYQMLNEKYICVIYLKIKQNLRQEGKSIKERISFSNIKAFEEPSE